MVYGQNACSSHPLNKLHMQVYMILNMYQVCFSDFGPRLCSKSRCWRTNCSRSILWMHTALGALLLHAPGAKKKKNMILEHVCIVQSNMLLEQIWLRILLQIICDPGAYAPETAAPRFFAQKQSVLKGKGLSNAVRLLSFCSWWGPDLRRI